MLLERVAYWKGSQWMERGLLEEGVDYSESYLRGGLIEENDLIKNFQ